MRGRFRAAWLAVNSSYWFLPAVLALVAFAAAVGTVWIDRHGGSEWLATLGWFEPSRPDGARAQLTVIASAAIAISSTVFAITIAAVAYASGNYGPRLLTNFMTDRGNQVCLGIFIAVFVYNLMVLRVVRNPANGETSLFEAAAFVPQVSVIVSNLSAILAVVALVFFLHHIPSSIRINHVLSGIGRRLLAAIEDRFRTDAVEGGDGPAGASADRGRGIAATATGYVELVDFEALDALAEAKDVVIALDAHPGDFVHPPLPLAHVHGADLGKDEVRALRGAFAIGSARTAEQNVNFLIDELVEIALRALSPGVNDPFTAVNSLDWLGAATTALASRSLVEGPEADRCDPDRVRTRPETFERFVARGFGNVRAAAATSPIAAIALLDALDRVAAAAPLGPRRRALAEEAARLLEQSGLDLAGPARAAVFAHAATLPRLRPAGGTGAAADPR